MKKKKINRKLPRYDLGTMKRLPLGYQQASGNGYASTSVEQGQSIQPEINAMRANRTPMAIGQMTQSFQYPMQILQNGTKTAVTPTAGSLLSQSIASTMASAPGLASVPLNTVAQTSSLANTLASTTGGKLLSGGGMLAAQKAAQTSSNVGSTAAAGAGAGASTLGMVAGGLGTLYGGWNMFNQFADASRHRNAADMQRTLNKYTFTTPGGNQYTEYGGVNAGDELSYEREAGHQKRTAQLINTAGTGASIGGLVASTGVLAGTKLGGALGSWAGPVGVGVGALLGAGIGELINLFGFGDNEEEVKEQIRRENDAIAMQNMQNRAVGKSRDLEAQAALGKPAYGKMKGGNKHGEKIELLQGPNGPTIGKASSMGQPGEPMYDASTMRGSIIQGKGNQDTEPLSVKQNDATAIFSKKLGFADIAAPIVEQQNKLHDIIANAKGNPKQQQFQKMMAEKALQKNHEELLALSEVQNIVRDDTMKIKKYNCGKMPKFSLGSKIADYSSAVLPHFWGFMTNLAQKNRDKYADSYVPEMEISNPEAIKAYNQVMSDMIDPTQYLNMSQRNYNQAAWNARRAVNAGYGGRMLMLDSLYRGKQQQDAETLMKINEMNRAQRNMGANLLNQYGTDKLAKRYDQFWKRFGIKQQQNAAGDYALRTDDLNMYKMWAGAADAYDAVNKYHQAYDIQNKQIGIWQQQANADTMRAIADTYRLGNPSYISPSTLSSVEPTPPLLIARPDDNYAYNNALKLRGW